MNTMELIQEAKTSGVTLTPLPNGRLQVTGRPQVPPELKAKLMKNKAEILNLLSTPPDKLLADAYRRYWTLPESKPMEAFQSILAEIALLEAQSDPGQVIDILAEAAGRFHRETGACPHCRKAGPLHHGPDGREP